MKSEFEKLAAKLHDLAEGRKKNSLLAVLVKQPEAARNDHADDDTGILAKALQYAHTHGALTGAQASKLDLLIRERRLPDNLRSALRAIDTTGGENP